MGLFCVNFHFQTADDKALAAALKRRSVTRFRLLPARGGWTTLYEARASDQDDVRIRELAAGLSQDLHAAAIAFLVHDSDFWCYWLFDNGQPLDEYNSCPDYFSDDAPGDAPSSPSGGKPDVLLPYCRAGVGQQDIAAILAEESLYAENVVERFAALLGIDRGRAIADFRDGAGGGGQDDTDGREDDDDDDDDDNGGGTLNVSSKRLDLRGRLAQMLGVATLSAAPDPQMTALVQAAAKGDVDEIDRLVAQGIAIDGEAAISLPGSQPIASLGHLFPGGATKIAMTPLLAAVVYKQGQAALRLLDRGADPNRVHPLFGMALHVATTAGEAQLLQVLLDHGGDESTRNAQGQTPLQSVAVVRATVERLAQAQTIMKSMGIKPPGLVQQMANVTLPTEGWDACERLLKARGQR